MTSAVDRDAMLAMLTPDLRLAAAYASRSTSVQSVALFAFDRTLSLAVSRASQPIVGQVRLAWWRDFLSRLNAGKGAADPVARAAANLAQHDPTRALMIAMVNGWERLLEPFPIADEALLAYAEGRGQGLFAALASLESRAVSPDAGKAWALVDFAFHCDDAQTAARALAFGKQALGDFALPRPLCILDSFARRDVSRGVDRGSATGHPSRLWDAFRTAISSK